MQQETEIAQPMFACIFSFLWIRFIWGWIFFFLCSQ